MSSKEEEMKPKRASGKRAKKRKFTGNIYTRKKMNIENSHNNECASERKLNSSSINNDDDIICDFNGYRVVDIELMFSFLQNFLCCKVCQGDINLNEEVVCGLSSKISLECKNCSTLCSFRNSKMVAPSNKISDINHKYIYAMRSIGVGYAGMKLFCGIMDLPKPISKKAYNSGIKKLLKCSNAVAQKSMVSAANQEQQLNGSTCINISGDGTWKTRGHTSRVGVCTVIGDISGKVIDTEVLSSYCKSCDTWKAKKGTQEYNSWKIKHEQECLINHSGSSGKMEMVGMVRIFQRSESKRNVKYIGYIGDGDAKTFQAITDCNPYGSTSKINKIECVGHIQKRMGTRLRKLKQSAVKCSDGKSVGGKGRLTDKFIDKLTVYYGNAIREHKNNLNDMRKAVWAVYFHTRSTDSEPIHNFCPSGPESWCRYNKAVCNGTLNVYKHKNTLPACVMDLIKPIFNDLSHPKLLGRCLGGKTQNNNESLNSLIWKLCPKTQGVGRRVVEIATSEAVILFNEGNNGRMNVLKEMGLSCGIHAKECFIGLDRERIYTSNIRFLSNTKEARRHKRRLNKTETESFLLTEGETYGAGAF